MTTVVDAEVQLTVVSDAAGRMRVQATGFQFDAGRAVAIEDTVGKVAGVQGRACLSADGIHCDLVFTRNLRHRCHPVGNHRCRDRPCGGGARVCFALGQ